MVTAVEILPRAPRRSSAAPPATPARSSWLLAALSLPGLLWLGLWFGINTGPGVLAGDPRSLVEEIHYARTLLPLVALAVGVLILLGRAAHGRGLILTLPRVLGPWLLYGGIALLACATSPLPAQACYWALSYLAVFFVSWAFIQAPSRAERLARCASLNHLTWLIAIVLLVALLVISRDALFVPDYGGNLSGYGVVNRVGPTAGVGMVRASGFARLAAIPAMVAFVFAWRGTGLGRLLWAAIAVGAAAVVYLMQSRGATLGLAAALAFAMLFMGRRSRVVGALALLFVAVSIVADLGWAKDSQEVVRHVARQRTWQEYSLTSGRTRDWAIVWSQIERSPLWGWGPQADRYLLGLHAHNTVLYAWLAAGLMGVLALLGGLLWSWRLLIRALRDQSAWIQAHRTMLVQTGCLLAFFTVRGIPEVSGGMFGVDLLLMLPAIAWLGVLSETPRDASEGKAPW